MTDTAATAPIAVDVYSDVICPWCYIGHRRLQTALAALAEGTDVRVRFRPYQLDPSAPETADPLHKRLARKFGPRAGAMLDHVTQQAAAEGLEMNWDRAISVNTLTAHRLLEFARLEGGEAMQLAMVDRLFELYFTEGGNIGDIEQLAVAAASAGLSPDRVRAHLASGNGIAELTAALAEARRLGVEAVPTFVIDGRYAVQGAQPAHTLVEALRNVAHPERR